MYKKNTGHKFYSCLFLACAGTFLCTPELTASSKPKQTSSSKESAKNTKETSSRKIGKQKVFGLLMMGLILMIMYKFRQGDGEQNDDEKNDNEQDGSNKSGEEQDDGKPTISKTQKIEIIFETKFRAKKMKFNDKSVRGFGVEKDDAEYETLAKNVQPIYYAQKNMNFPEGRFIISLKTEAKSAFDIYLLKGFKKEEWETAKNTINAKNKNKQSNTNRKQYKDDISFFAPLIKGSFVVNNEDVTVENKEFTKIDFSMNEVAESYTTVNREDITNSAPPTREYILDKKFTIFVYSKRAKAPCAMIEINNTERMEEAAT